MKKLLLSTLVSISFVACDRDRAESVNQETLPSLVGTWKISKRNVYDGKTNALLISQDIAPCENKNPMQFFNDGKLQRHIFEELNGVCEDTGIDQGTYTYNANTKVLRAVTPDGTFIEEVLKLTDTELEVTDNTSSDDINGDGVKDKHAFLLIRIN